MISNPSNNLTENTGLNYLRKRDYLFIYAPLILPFIFYRLEINIINSLAFVLYYLYAIFIVLKNSRRLSRLDFYFVLCTILLVFQILIGNRLGFNSSLALIGFVVVYKEVISRLSIRKSLSILVGLYTINILYMALEVVSQLGLFPSIVNTLSNPYSVIKGLSVGSSLYMHTQACGLVAIVALMGSLFGIFRAQSFNYRLIFILSAIVSLILLVVNVRGTPLLSFALAMIVMIMVKLSKRGVYLFVFIIVGSVFAVILNADFLMGLFGYKFTNATTGEFNEVLLSMYFDMFLIVVYLWQISSLFSQLFGQSINSINPLQFTGEFAFGNILYFEGLIALFLYVSFVFNQCRVSSKNIILLNKFEASIVYFNLFAVIVYFTSLLHYGNAINIGIANLMAFHIAFNIIIVKAAKQHKPGPNKLCATLQ